MVLDYFSTSLFVKAKLLREKPVKLSFIKEIRMTRYISSEALEYKSKGMVNQMKGKIKPYRQKVQYGRYRFFIFLEHSPAPPPGYPILEFW